MKAKDIFWEILKIEVEIGDRDWETRYEFLSTTGHLVSESISSSVDGVLSVNLEFKDYYNKD